MLCQCFIMLCDCNILLWRFVFTLYQFVISLCGFVILLCQCFILLCHILRCYVDKSFDNFSYCDTGGQLYLPVPIEKSQDRNPEQDFEGRLDSNRPCPTLPNILTRHSMLTPVRIQSDV